MTDHAAKAKEWLRSLTYIVPLGMPMTVDGEPLLGTCIAYSQGATVPVLTEAQVERYSPSLTALLEQVERDAVESFYKAMTKAARERGAENVYAFMLEYCGAASRGEGEK